VKNRRPYLKGGPPRGVPKRAFPDKKRVGRAPLGNSNLGATRKGICKSPAKIKVKVPPRGLFCSRDTNRPFLGPKTLNKRAPKNILTPWEEEVLLGTSEVVKKSSQKDACLN